MRKLIPFILSIAFALHASATGTFTVVTAACHNDGVLKVTFAGLTPPLSVAWTTQGTTGTTITHSSVSGLFDVLTSYSGGPVLVSATDALGATDSSYFFGAAPFTYSDSSTAATCPGLGSVSVGIFGGTAPFTVQWFDMTTMATVATGTPATLPAGSYGVVITDAAGCVSGSTVFPGYATISSIPAFEVTTAATTASCTNGTASVTGTLGTAVMPLSYLWSNGGTSATISGLTTGDYVVTVTDALGCSAVSDAYVLQSVVINAPTTTTPATCIDTNGSIIAFGSGGLPPYSYLWSNGATTQAQTGLAAGYYYVTVTDANGCIGDGFDYVGTSTPITATYSSSPSLCTAPTGTATLSMVGGTAPYSVLWSTFPVQTAVTATSLAPGTYHFNVTDAVGCVRSGDVTVPPISLITAAYTATSALCTLSTGGLNVTPTSGVAPFSYLWSTGSTASSISGVPGGFYSVRITDNASCKITKYYEVPVNSPVSVGLTSTDASCIYTNDGTIHATAFGGTAPYSYGWSSGGVTSTISGLHYGPYWMHVTDAIGCTANDYTYVGYNAAADDCYCTITGTIYHDANNNCVQDAGEAGIPHVQVGCTGRGYTYTDATGHYSFMVPSGTYTVTQTVLAFYPLAACQSNNIVVSASAAAGCVHTVDFADAMDTIHDMHICTWDYHKPVPGNIYTQTVIVKNDGTVDEAAVLAGYKPDGQLLTPAFTPSGIFTGSPYWYNTLGGYPTVAPGTASAYYITYNVPTNIPINTSVLFKDSVSSAAPMASWLADYSPWNNVNYFTTPVVASYDPNFKEVNPKGTGPTGLITYNDSTLEYMVHFQNTGTAPAQNVLVVDTLDANLNWASLRPSFESAPCKVTLEQLGSSKVVKFLFSNINLPAQSVDDLRSNGMFSYTIKTNSGLPVGTQFRNRASIYFDYNEPVLTNTTLNTLGATPPVAVANTAVEAVNSFNVYPNPAAKTFYAAINAATAGTADIRVADVTGKVMIAKTINVQKGAQNIATDASQLAPGIYFVSFINNGKTQTQKLVIIK